MPITLKKNELFIKDEVRDEFRPTNVIAEQTSAQVIGEIESAGGAELSAIASAVTAAETAMENKAAETIASIPDDYTQLASDVDDLKQDYSELNTQINTETDIDFSDATVGQYISSSGYVGNDQNFAMVSFEGRAGDTIVFTATGYLNYVAMISTYVNGTYYRPRANSIDSTQHTYTYTLEEDATVYLSYLKSASKSAYTKSSNIYTKSEIDEKFEQINEETIDVDFSEATAGQYVSSSGNIGESSAFSMLTFNGKKGDKISFTATGYNTTVAMISIYDGTPFYKVKATSIDSSEHTYTYTMTDDGVVCLSYNNSKAKSATITRITVYSRDAVDELVGNLKNEINGYDVKYLHLLDTIGMVGDSLSSGEVYPQTGDTPKDMHQFSWLENICKDIGASAKYYSKGGLSAYAWMNDSGGCKTTMLADEAQNAYYVGFGTNDKSYYEVGTATDTSESGTFAGWYNAVLDTIHEHAPNAVIFCVSLYETNATADTFSNMIQSIANNRSYCYYIDYIGNTDDDLKITSASTNFIHNWHYTGLGYARVGEIIKRLTNNVINANLSAFKYFAYNQ